MYFTENNNSRSRSLKKVWWGHSRQWPSIQKSHLSHNNDTVTWKMDRCHYRLDSKLIPRFWKFSNFWKIIRGSCFACDGIGIKRCGIFLRIFWYMFVASCPPTRTPTQKLKKVYFYSEFPGNWFEFGIIEIDFSSSTIRAIQIHDSFAGFKNPKNPGI